MDKRTIISISRQYGSGGREVAQLLAKKTGFHLYDRQIIDSAAKELGISNWTEEQLKALETSEPAPSGSSPSILLGLLKARQTRACSSLNRKSSANWQNRVPASSSAAAATSSCATFPNTIPSLSAPTTISVPNAAGQNMTARPFRKSRLKTRNGPIITNTIRENVGDSLKNILYPSTLQKSPSTRQLT